MNANETCPVCRSPLSSGTPTHLCPVCLLGAGLETDTRSELAMIAEKPGDMVGRYRLLEQIGEGGFGVVFLAEQRIPVRRRVALKVVKPGMDSREVVSRFEAERQALALMNHPNIAKVYDAGTTDMGRPYFVMEHVKGRPLTVFCDKQALAIRARLELFVGICQAVQHAHQKGVIHRDLKPGNILVREDDEGAPLPKIIDFGVAKAIGIALTEKTLLTMFGRILGTPLYMSPEQAGLHEADVDTRSDIYTLGVVLYELVTGRTPLGEKGLTTASFDETRRRIREEEPLRPSARVFSLADDQRRAAAKARHIDPAKYRRYLSGDLDWIVMKALEKDRTRRYETAQCLGADVRRYLDGLPVNAGPPGAAYRIGKYVRRHRGPVLASALALLAAIGGTAGFWMVNIDKKATIEVEQQKAEKERKEKEFRGLELQVEGVKDMRRDVPGSRKAALGTLLKIVNTLDDIGVADIRAQKLRDKARNEFVACLAWTDLEEKPLPISAMVDPSGPAALDGDHRRCVLSTKTGHLEVWDLVSGKQERTRAHPGPQIEGPLQFNHDGTLVAAGFGTAAGWDLVLWDWSRNTDLVTTKLQGANAAFDFHPHGDGCIVGTPMGTIEVIRHDWQTKRELLSLGAVPLALRYSPDGQMIAVGMEHAGVVVIAVTTGKREDTWEDVSAVSLAWAPDGKSLVAGCADGSVTILERGVQHPVFNTMAEHCAKVDQVAWSPDGRLIASACENQLRLWDGRQEKLLCQYDKVWAPTLGFSSADESGKPSALGPVLKDGALGTLEIPQSQACHRAAGHRQQEIIASTWLGLAKGTVLVTAAGDGLRIWNHEGQQLAHDPAVRVRPGGLVHGQDYLYLATEDGILRRRVFVADGKLTCGSDEVLDAELQDGQQIVLSPPGGPLGTFLAVARDDEVVLFDLEPGAPRRSTLQALPSTAFLALSPDGAWLAAGTRNGQQVRLWHLADPADAPRDLPAGGGASVAFYPRTSIVPHLMTGSDESYRMWRHDPSDGSWTQLGDAHPSKMRNRSERLARMVFSPRGTVVVVTYNFNSLQILHPITMEVMHEAFDEQWPLAISPDGRHLATEAPRGRVFLWDLSEVRRELGDLDWPEELLPSFKTPTPPVVIP